MAAYITFLYLKVLITHTALVTSNYMELTFYEFHSDIPHKYEC